jgi:hypothetical protein
MVENFQEKENVMSKHHQQNKVRPTNRVATSISVGPETPDQMKEQMGPLQPSSEAGFVPTYEDIQKRAYQIHEEKGGSDLENWLEAEHLLKEEHPQAQR